MTTPVLHRIYETDADTKYLAKIPNNSHIETGETTQRSKKTTDHLHFCPTSIRFTNDLY
jgi:hypothetical protein